MSGPADFAAAAAACIDAASPDKLEARKLTEQGWAKQSEVRAPFGETAIYSHAGSPVRIYASPSPSGFCIVDGYGQDSSQFEAYRSALADRFKADYGTSGLTDVAVGDPAADDRRQGFVIGNAVAGYSAVMRAEGLSLRFTVANAKFAGSPKLFQASRPPVSEAEITEVRAKDRAAEEFAREPGSAQDLLAMARACATALRADGALQGDDWRRSTHASGSPRAMDAAKKRDVKAMLAGMAHSRQVLFRAGQHGLVTKYFVRGVTNLCEATVYVDPASVEAVKAEAIAALALNEGRSLSRKAKDFVDEYLISDLDRTYRWEQSEVGFHKGFGTSLDGPDSGKSSLSIFVF